MPRVSEILNKNSRKPINFLTAGINLGERNNYKFVALKKRLIEVFGGTTEE